MACMQNVSLIKANFTTLLKLKYYIRQSLNQDKNNLHVSTDLVFCENDIDIEVKGFVFNHIYHAEPIRFFSINVKCIVVFVTNALFLSKYGNA